jgi:3-dehydroquinate dehydratase
VSNKPLNISESAAVQMPMKTVVSLIALVAIGTWAYFGLHETLNKHSTQIELMQKDLEHNTEFLQKQVEKAIIDIEDLKDANREIVYKNGNGH